MSDPFNSDVKAESLSPAAFLKKRLLESRSPEKAAEIAAKTDGFQGIRNRQMIDLLKSQAGAAELRDAANERLLRTGQSDLEAAQNELDSGRRAAMEGTNRFAFDVAALPFTVQSYEVAGQVDPKTWDILQREINGEQLTAEDQQILDARPQQTAPGVAGLNGVMVDQGYSNKELAVQAGWAAQKGSDIQEYGENTAWANKLNTRLRESFTEDISEAYTEGGSQASFQAAEKAADEGDYMSAVTQSAAGVAQLVRDGGKAVMENPQAAFEFIAENLPQLAVGAVSKTALTAINVAYGAGVYQDGIDTYREENNGAMPPKAQMDKMLAFSIAAAAAENIADMSLLKGLSKIPGTDKATKKAMDSVVGKIVNNKVTNNVATRIAGTAAKNVGTEAVTEVTQTYLEEAVKGNEASGEELAQAFVIGGASGGGIGATTKSIGELRTAGAEALKASEDYQVDKRADSEQIKTAVVEGRETGDVSALLDPEKPETYAPESAAITLWQRSLDPELDPQERADASVQYKEIVKQQEEKVKFAEESYSQVDPEVIAQYEEQLKDPDLDPELKPLLEQTVNEAKAEGRKGAKERLQKLKVEQTRLAQLNELRNVDSQVQSEPVIAENLDSAKEGVKPAIKGVIDAMVVNPDAVSEEDIQTIGESAAPEQKKFLARTQQFLRAFSEADAAANEARGKNGVQNDVINGRVGFKGIKEYVRNVGAALASNNREEVDTEYNQLKLFSSEHQIKQEKMAEAIALTEETGKDYFLVRDYSADSGWKVTDTKPPKWNRRRNGGFEIKPKSLGGAKKVYASIEAENAAINAGLAQIEAQIELKTGTPVENPTAPEEASDSADQDIQDSSAPKLDQNDPKSIEMQSRAAAKQRQDKKTESMAQIQQLSAVLEANRGTMDPGQVEELQGHIAKLAAIVEDAPSVAEPQSVAGAPQQPTATEPPTEFADNTPPLLGPDGETVVEPEINEPAAGAVPSEPTISELEAMPPQQLKTFKDNLELQSKAIGLNENQEPLLKRANELLADVVPLEPTIAELGAMPPQQLKAFKDDLELQSKTIGLNENQKPLLNKANELLAKAVPFKPTIAQLGVMPVQQLKEFKNNLELQNKVIGLNENQESLLNKANELLGETNEVETELTNTEAQPVITEDPGFNEDAPPPRRNEDASP